MGSTRSIVNLEENEKAPPSERACAVIGRSSAAISQPEARRARWLMDLIRGLLATLLQPAMGVSFPVIRAVAWQRERARRRARERCRLEAAPRNDGRPGATNGRAADVGQVVSSALPETAHESAKDSQPTRAARVQVVSQGPRTAVVFVTRGDNNLFSIIKVAPDFGPRAYAAAFLALQVPTGSKLFDLTPATMVSLDLFERLAKAWTSPAGAVPRLALAVSFERWVMCREVALAALEPIAAQGVRIALLYDAQINGTRLAAWLERGHIVHNVRGVVDALTAGWTPSAVWPSVIEMLARLSRAHARAAELPGLLTDVAGLALSCGGADQARLLAHEALDCLPVKPSPTRGRALRELGVALLGQGQTMEGLRMLDHAAHTAAMVGDSSVGASALYTAAVCSLNHGDHAAAEGRLRAAIKLLAPAGCARLLAQAHHHLAVVLHHRRSDDAEYHAGAALALRSDAAGHLAEQDRLLLARVREQHTRQSEPEGSPHALDR